jgi:hypothetical protein
LQRYQTESGTSLQQVRDSLKRLQGALRPYQKGLEDKPENVQEAVRALREAQRQMSGAVASAAQPRLPVAIQFDGRGLPVAGRERSLDGSLLALKIWYQRQFKEELKVHGTSSSEGGKKGIVVVEDAGIPFVKGDGTHRDRLTMDPAARKKLSQLGFRVLPGGGNELRLSFQGDSSFPPGPTSSPARAGGGTPSAPRPELAPQNVIERFKKGQDLGVRTPDEAKRVLEGLLKTGQYDWYRGISEALSNKGILPINFSIANMPFSTLKPSMDFISVVSISEVKNHQYFSGQRADSLEMKIRVNGHPVTLLAPRNADFDQFLHNVGMGLQPFVSSPLLREVNRIVLDPGEKKVIWKTSAGKAVNDTALARAIHPIGELVFFNGGGSFTSEVFHHEMGHLLADKLKKGEMPQILRNLPLNVGPWAETAEPGDRFTALWQKQGSYSPYGRLSVVEGFAEAWKDYMTNRGDRLPPEQVKLLQSLGISNTFSSSLISLMSPIGPFRPPELSRPAAKGSTR